MITQLKIENYKSIQELTLDVGRVNVLIGENGCGKSNILEAITFAGAAAAGKLGSEFLYPRGIRVTEPKLMRSVFDDKHFSEPVKINIGYKGSDNVNYHLTNDNKPYSDWFRVEFDYDDKRLLHILFSGLQRHLEEKDKDSNVTKKNMLEMLKNNYPKNEGKDEVSFSYIEHLFNGENEIKKFIIYSPENTSLRNLEKEAQIQPLGINGEGLFKLLTIIQNEAEQSQDFSELNDIQETLELFGWFESIKIPNDYLQLEQKITLQDRYLEMPFDQRSANEGFLLVLFYITLVVSKYTPKIFAIDNIDTSLNPKLCTKLIKELTRLAKKYDKQIFLTSHNPAILDGIDLSDDEQRLFVVSRNREGHTCCNRVELKDKPKSSIRARLSRIFDENKTYTKAEILEQFDNSDEPLKLSYALLRGYLGGLPENFDL